MDKLSFFKSVRQSDLFGGFLSQPQVDGTNAILDCFNSSMQTDVRWLAYDLATTYHETARAMVPVDEVNRGRGRPYGLPVGPWHNVYYGRGDVQLTWESNYAKAKARLAVHGLNVDLDRHPELADTPKVAAMILVYGCAEGWFSGVGLGKFFSDTRNDPVGARHIVNGSDRASLVARYHETFLSALKSAGQGGRPL